MEERYIEVFRRHLRPLEPIPTGAVPSLRKLEGIRAVLFDVYGTLVISASGEVGTAGASSDRALEESLAAAGVKTAGPADDGVELLFDAIRSRHAELRATGVEHPEVDICAMWGQVLEKLRRTECHSVPLDAVKRLAIEYEARANPCWPMPHLEQCLDRLRGAGPVLGIVSNAQFYTPLLFPALLGKPIEHWFDTRLLFFSYEHGQAKPGTVLYERAAAALGTRGIGPREVLYVGNDMLNDVLPSRKVGFHTALFAGDRRSLRLREGDGRLEGVAPDLVLTDLGQLAGCVLGGR
jgi:putative hydrolase of the HAD superfamily